MSDIVTTLQEKVKEIISEVAVLEEEIGTIAGGGYVPAGSVYFADLPALSDSRYGFVYNIKDEFTTTFDFIEGAGKTYSAGTNVGIVKNELQQLKYDVFSAFINTGEIYDEIDTKQDINLSKTIAGATTVEGALEAIASGGGGGVTVDTEMSITSENPVQNKVITAALNDKLDSDGKAVSAASADFATKATNDGADNNIVNTYITKTDAASTYLGKNEKAASASTADSATSATTDGSGNNIVNTYETKSDAANRELGNIADVNISNPTDGQVLTYDEENDEWKNSPNTGGSTVSVTQIKSSGEKIATITVDGVPTDLYASSGGGGGGAVDSVNGKTGNVVLDATDVGALPDNTSIPSKTSDLTNDSNFVADASYVHTDNNYDATAKTAVDALGTASTKDVAVSGDAGSTEVVMGNDSRLSDARTPVSHTHTLSDITDAGTAAGKDSTNAVTSGSTDLVESGAVKSAIDAVVASAYHAAGTKTVAELISSLLVAANEGDVYNMTDAGTTTSDFIEGAGKFIRIGDNVGIAKVGNEYKFDLLSGFVDTSNFIEKSVTSGLVKNDGTIDTNNYATTSQLPDITGKADKVASAVNGNFAGLDSNGNLTDSGSKASDFLTSHQDISGKADKVSSATNGNLATLDSNGNLTDSGVAKTSLTFMDKSRYMVASSGWSVSTDADGYYTNAVSLSKNLDTTYPPNVYFDESVGNDNGEEDAYMTIDKFALTATGTLTAYATTKPTDSTYIYVEGRLA